MMTKCANCELPLFKAKDLRNVRKISWLNTEFDCPHCDARLSNSCVWNEVLAVSVLVTTIVLALFAAFNYIQRNAADGLFAWLQVATTLVLIIVMLVSSSKSRTRVLDNN